MTARRTCRQRYGPRHTDVVHGRSIDLVADDDDPNDAINPFAGLPMFGDLAKALSGQGPLNWDAARQFALLSASGGSMLPGSSGAATPPNVDPSVRIKYAELADIARLHVSDVMQLDVPTVEPSVATPEQWALQTLEAYRPLFTDLATSLGPSDGLARHRRRRSDGPDDGRPRPDDGAGDARHERRLDGRQPRPQRVRRRTTCRSPGRRRRSCSCRRRSTSSPSDW